MLKRDLLKTQIDQLGKLLEKLISELTSQKTHLSTTEVHDFVYKSLKETGLDLQELLDLPDTDYPDALKARFHLENDHLKQLAEIFYFLAEKSHNKTLEDLTFYGKCLSLNQYLKATDADYSLERHFRIKKIQGIINSIKPNI